MHRLIIPLLLGTALFAQTSPPKNYQRTELSQQQKQALLDLAHRQVQAKLKAGEEITPAVPQAKQFCAVPLVNALRPETPIPLIQKVPIPEGNFPIEHAQVPPVCELGK